VGDVPRFLRWPAAVLRALGAVELAVSVVGVFIIIVSIAAQVLLRYVFNAPLIWVEEAATISFIWMTMLGAAAAAKMDRHIWISTFGSFLSVKHQRTLALGGSIFVLGMAALVAWYALGYIHTQNRSMTVSLPVNIPRGFVFAVPTFIAMASIALTQIVKILDNAVRLRRDPTATPLVIMST
jgi:TRAP-type C4-dicarboxylate transport system permease small subunit